MIIEVVLNYHAYFQRLLPNDQIITRHGIGAEVAIYGPGKTKEILGPFE